MSKHTPGPWRLKPFANGYDLCIDGVSVEGQGGWFLELHHGLTDRDTPELWEEFEANAALIAAAPETAAERDNLRAEAINSREKERLLFREIGKLREININKELLTALEIIQTKMVANHGHGKIAVFTWDDLQTVNAAIAKAYGQS